MLFELLTGHLPFESDSIFAIAAMRLTQPPPDPRVHRPELPESIANLVMRCMARKPEDRPQRAAEIATRLASLTIPAFDALATTGAARAAGAPEQLRVLSIAPDNRTDALQRTVAVLPIRNAGPPEDDYLVDGLTDDLIDALSMTPGLRVRPRGIVMQHKNVQDPRSIGRDLGVQVVVEGTMRSTADAIRVSARVLSVEDGFQIWAKRFDGTRADVLRIGDEASREVAAALSSRAPTRAALATDPDALDLYLRGRHEYFKYWATANERAIELLRAAHDRAPSDALIMAAYAGALARQFGVGSSNPIDRTALARHFAEEAIRIAPHLADAHLALAQAKLHEPDVPGTAAGVVRALSLSPLLPDAHQLRSRLLAEVGTPRETIEAASRAMQLEPRYAPQLRYDVQARARAMLGEWNLEDYGPPPEDADAANLYWIMAVRYTMWKRDPALSAKLGEALLKLDSQSVLARAFVGWIFDHRLSQSERSNIDSRKTSTNITQRMRIFWNQLSAEVNVYTSEPALADVRAAVDLGLVDIAWMDLCPLFDELRKTPEWSALRETVAARARIVRMQLEGGQATVASA